ncbi:PREDICTED: protein FAR1-RELATED SEQUENCE 5-like [Camelina sativa]|uniref:Protein FAR1-RELATED SEQUENCE n=1 Tax=Camelina sativa TaxID=90675 RepID=A0ABM0US48_CAMSA|nr:PREDICTED: protein FAR1-RELATED SEQUENCE 5-like [Camelina sativa]
MENSYISEDFSPKEDYDSISVDTASVSESVEKEDNIANNENYVQTEEVVVLEANKESELKDELCIGMEFSSDETAHTTYQKYGGSHGFDVRKQRRTIKKEKVVRLRYVCSKEGYRKETNDEKSYSQPITRCGCNAHMTCYLQKNERYKIVSFEENHNHDLVRTPMKHLLRGNRALSISKKKHADDAEMSGISAKATVEMMSREVGGRENLGFLAKDYQNYIYRKRMAKMEKGDVGALDEDDMITNIFWADDRSISDYNLFGDVVCFDTTYKTNEYDRPFAPFVGVNHHKQTVVFGAALLYDETIESYRWLFETFLGAMSGKQPKTILTDQCAAMANAIVKVFPETKHRLCVWHIYQNAAKKLSHVFHGAEQFAMDFSKCVYDHEEEQDWLLAWSDMLEKHKLTEDKWLKNLFELKEKWAMVYGRHTFTADMVSTQRSESMNNILKKYLKRSYNLLCFFGHYERVLEDRRYKELIADFNMMHTSPVLCANVEMLQHAQEVYTPEVFSLFQRQYIVIGDYVATKVSKSEMVYEYKVSYRGVAREHLVNYDAISQTIHCGCMKFSFAGILCRHALKVLDKKNVRRIPSTYILTRWSKEAKTRRISYYHPKTFDEREKQSIGRRYSHICRTFREIASVAADHIELTLCANEDAIQLLRKLEEKKKELVKANAWMPQSSDVGLVEEEEEVEDKEVPNARGIKRKASVGRPKNQKVGPHGRYLNVLEDTTLTPDTQLSVTTTSPTLHHESFISQVFKEYDKSYGGPS